MRESISYRAFALLPDEFFLKATPFPGVVHSGTSRSSLQVYTLGNNEWVAVFKEDESSLLTGVHELKLAQELVSQSPGGPPHRKVWQLGNQYDLVTHQVVLATPKSPPPPKTLQDFMLSFLSKLPFRTIWANTIFNQFQGSREDGHFLNPHVDHASLWFIPVKLSLGLWCRVVILRNIKGFGWISFWDGKEAIGGILLTPGCVVISPYSLRHSTHALTKAHIHRPPPIPVGPLGDPDDMGFDGAIRTEDGDDAREELHASNESRETETLRPFHPDYAPPVETHVTEPEILREVLHRTKVWLKIRGQNKRETWNELLGSEPKIRPINFGALYVYHQLRVRLSLPFELEGEITKYNAIYLRNALTLDLGLKGSTHRDSERPTKRLCTNHPKE